MAKKTQDRDLQTAQAEVDRLSNESARLHQELGQAERALEGARNKVSGGEPGASDQLARANQRVARLREQQRETEGRLVEVVAERDRAQAREQLAKAERDVERAAKVRELLTEREKAVERVEAAIQELGAAVAQADDVAWRIRRDGGQEIANSGVSNMLDGRQLRAAMWCQPCGDSLLGRRIEMEKPHKPQPLSETDRGARSKLLAACARVEARPAELKAKADGREKEAA